MIYSAHRSATGITLVELMVALTISLIILAVIIQIFVSSKATYTLEEGLARVQENGRFAVETLSTDIRMAGHFGCISLPPGQIPARPEDLIENIAVIPAGTNHLIHDATARAGVFGFRHVGTGNDPATSWDPPFNTSGYYNPTDIDLRPFSDIIVAKYATSRGVQLINDRFPTSDASSRTPNGWLQIDSTNANLYSPGDIVMVTKCNTSARAAIFKITAFNPLGATTAINYNIGAMDNTQNSLAGDFGRGDEFLDFNTVVYYVADTDRRDRRGNPIPALFRKVLVSGAGVAATLPRTELVEGVEAIRVFYGLSDPSQGGPVSEPTQYVPADQVPAIPGWNLVKSVRIAVVVASVDEITETGDNMANIDLFGLAADPLDDYDPPDDGRQRRVFSVLINKRQPPVFN